MPNQLKGIIVNMKSLSQHIQDPILIGGGEDNGRTLTVIFTQEAAAQFSDNTHVYLSWRHIQKNVKGYNVFTEVPREDTDKLTAQELPPTWTINFPKQMLHEGDVIATIELVDDISVAASTTFTIKILADPWEGSNWIENDDLSEFKIALNRASQLEEEIDKNHGQMIDAINHLYKMFDVTPFKDENEDGQPDEESELNSLIEINNTGGLSIIEWKGE